MALVRIWGNAWDHAQVPIPAEKRPELWFRPNASNNGGGLLAGVERKATLKVSTGEFEVNLFSDLTQAISYRPVLRWLENPEEANPERWSFGYTEWPFDVYPDVGGEISDLIIDQTGVGRVYCATDAVNPTVRTQLQFNTVTNDLYERVVTW